MGMELLLNLLLLGALGVAVCTAVYMIYSLITLFLVARKQKRQRVERIIRNVYQWQRTEIVRYSMVNVDKGLADLSEPLKEDKCDQLAIISNHLKTNTDDIKVEIAPYVNLVLKESNNKNIGKLQELLSAINKGDKFQSSDNQLRGAIK